MRKTFGTLGAAMGFVALVAGAFGQEYSVDVIEQPAGGFALYPMDISNSGVVVGWWYGSPVDNRHPFMYSAAGGYVQLPKPPGYAHSVPMAVNSSGAMVGYAQTVWNDESNPRGWKYENGQFTLFPAQTSVSDINDSGLVAGKACVSASGTVFNCFFSSAQPPVMSTVAGSGGYPVSMWKYIAVNSTGQMAYTPTGTTAVFVDTNGTVSALPPVPAGWTGVRVDGINDAGQVIARWTRSTTSPQVRYYSHGFLWSRGAGLQEFGLSDLSVRPKGINNRGEVVIETGTHDSAFFDTWVWTQGTGARNLEPIIDPALQIIMTDVYAINNNGQIVAGGTSQLPPANNISFVLSPTAPPGPACDSIDFNGDGLFPDTLDIDDFLSVFSGGPCSTGACGDVDFNNDSLFPDTLDVEALLSVFGGGACLG